VNRFGVADLVVVAAEVLGTDTGAVLELLDLDAAARALADPVPPVEDPAARAGVLLHGLLQERPLARGNRRVALIATAQFLAVNGWRLDPGPAGELVDVLRAAAGPAALTTWIRRNLRPVRTPTEETSMFAKRRTRRSPVLGRLDDRARRVVTLAREEARLHQHNYVGTEHLLLGLLHEGEGTAARALRSCRVDLKAVRDGVDAIIGRGSGVPDGRIPLTPRAMRVLELSVREAQSQDRMSAATEHVLLGLLREGSGVAAVVLGQLDLSLDEVRDQVLRLIEDDPPAAAGSDELRSAIDAAIDAGDFPAAAALRARQRDLLADARDPERLRLEVERLRALLRDAGIDPDARPA
jgi:Clp amino terminal domain, pathogenicity island component